MEKTSRRRLRSASVQLGALTALALTLSGCNQVGDDDDDCDSRSNTVPQKGSFATVGPVPVAVGAGAGRANPEPVSVLPSQSGFGTHLAACGG